MSQCRAIMAALQPEILAAMEAMRKARRSRSARQEHGKDQGPHGEVPARALPGGSRATRRCWWRRCGSIRRTLVRCKALPRAPHRGAGRCSQPDPSPAGPSPTPSVASAAPGLRCQRRRCCRRSRPGGRRRSPIEGRSSWPSRASRCAAGTPPSFALRPGWREKLEEYAAWFSGIDGV